MSQRKTGPRVGSRPWQLLRLKPGERIFLEAPPGRSQAFMQQVAADIQRNNLRGKRSQTLILGVEPATRTIIDIVMVTNIEEQS